MQILIKSGGLGPSHWRFVGPRWPALPRGGMGDEIRSPAGGSTGCVYRKCTADAVVDVIYPAMTYRKGYTEFQGR